MVLADIIQLGAVEKQHVCMLSLMQDIWNMLCSNITMTLRAIVMDGSTGTCGELGINTTNKIGEWWINTDDLWIGRQFVTLYAFTWAMWAAVTQWW
jgi:hypothetical protein